MTSPGGTLDRERRAWRFILGWNGKGWDDRERDSFTSERTSKESRGEMDETTYNIEIN